MTPRAASDTMPPSKTAKGSVSKKKATAPPAGATPAKRAKKSAAKATPDDTANQRAKLKKAWVGAPALIVSTDGEVFLASAITKPKGGSWQLKMVGVAKSTADKTVDISSLSTGIEDGHYKQIIQHFIGARYECDEYEVRVTDVVEDGAGVIVVKHSAVQAAGSVAAGEELDPLAIDVFMRTFKAAGTPNRDSDTSTSFDFSPYPRLLRVLRVARAFGVDAEAAEMPKEQAAAIMLGMKTTSDEESVAAACGRTALDLGELAQELERIYAGEAQSPELSRLTRLASTGILDEASGGARGKACRELALHASEDAAGDPSLEADDPPDQHTGTPSNEGPKQRAPTPGAPQPRGPRKRVVDEADQFSQESESINSSEDEEMEPIPIRPKKRQNQAAGGSDKPGQPAAQQAAKTGSMPAGKQRAHEAQPAESGPEEDEPETQTDTGLGSVCPPGMRQIDAARVIFAEEAVRAVANCQPIPEHIAPEATARLTTRYSLAFNRLVARVGLAWRTRQAKPARNAKMLEDWAEAILDIVAQGTLEPATLLSRDAENHRPIGPLFPAHLSESVEPADASKPTEGLSGAKQAGSISPEVCQRLHDHQAQYEAAIARAAARGGSAADVISEVPANLRNDLQRAALSNALVDAPGETRRQRRSLPPFAHGQRRMTLREAEAALKLVPKADSTGQVSLDTTAVATVSAAVQDGSFTFSDFQKLANDALGSGAAPAGTAAANSEAWSFMQPVFLSILTSVGAPHAEVEALAQIGAVINSPPGIARLSPADVADWVERIIKSYRASLREFRLHESALVSLRSAMAEHDKNFTFKSLKSSLGSYHSASHGGAKHDSNNGKAAAKMPQQNGQASRPPKRGAPAKPARQPQATPNPTPSASANAQGQPPRAPRPGVALWTERTTSLPDAKFNEVRDAAKAKWQDLCTFAMVAKCTRVACPKKHERPRGFEDFLKDHGLKLNGEVSQLPDLKHTRTHERPAGH